MIFSCRNLLTTVIVASLALFINAGNETGSDSESNNSHRSTGGNANSESHKSAGSSPNGGVEHLPPTEPTHRHDSHGHVGVTTTGGHGESTDVSLHQSAVGHQPPHSTKDNAHTQHHRSDSSSNNAAGNSQHVGASGAHHHEESVGAVAGWGIKYTLGSPTSFMGPSRFGASWVPSNVAGAYRRRADSRHSSRQNSHPLQRQHSTNEGSDHEGSSEPRTHHGSTASNNT